MPQGICARSNCDIQGLKAWCMRDEAEHCQVFNKHVLTVEEEGHPDGLTLVKSIGRRSDESSERD